MQRRIVRGALLLFAAALYAQTDEQSIRDLIQTFADARNRGNGAAVASLYSEDGEWIPSSPSGIPTKGHAALTKLWTNLPGKVERTIQSIEFPSSRLAVVRVATQYAAPIGRHNEVFVLVKEVNLWRIRVHHTAD
jgi:uncharacterized protein (TIGR02246 family)